MGRTSFLKRDKERKRKEKQEKKAQRRVERKLIKTELSSQPEENAEGVGLTQEANTMGRP